MAATKSVFESKTIGVWLLLVMGFLAELVGFDLDITDGTSLAEIVQFVSALLIPFFRYVSTHRLKLPKFGGAK